MLFNSFVFIFAFLPVTYTVFWLLRTSRARYVWLTATGYVFYGYWNPRFCLLMAFSTLVSYSAGLGFLRWTDPRRRKLCLVVPIVVDLSLLAFFKYANFGLQTARGVAHVFGADVSVPHLDIILPVGISFYTFHTITYIVDSYRGVIRPTRNFFEFSTYVSLFSQLVAGPIVRFRQIEEDLEAIAAHDRRRWIQRGVSFFVIGLVEKVLVADTLAAFVDPALASYASLSTLGAWMAMLGYSFQLYFDFSGYSTMAVGLGYLFGLRIPQNFNSPYKATDPSDFWRRWHISLSTFLRDYVYIPLGGSRRGVGRYVFATICTMGLCGLWHGAGWTYVSWGLLHGVGLIVCRNWQQNAPRLPAPVGWALTMLFVIVGWVLFRAASFETAGLILASMSGVLGVTGALAEWKLMGIAALVSVAVPSAHELIARNSWPQPVYAVAFALIAAFCVFEVGKGAPVQFIYFQF